MPGRTKPRSFTTHCKLDIVTEHDAAPDGEQGAVLRREGFYPSHVHRVAPAHHAAQRCRQAWAACGCHELRRLTQSPVAVGPAVSQFLSHSLFQGTPPQLAALRATRRPRLDDLFQGLVVVGKQGSPDGLAGAVVVPDRGGEREDALEDADGDSGGCVAAVSFEVELSLECVVD